ncbi:MAG: alpha-ketoacid dehydrogenase subunit beta [Planctomycetota bacterium]
MKTPDLSAVAAGRRLSYGAALRESLAQSMRRDPRIVVLGEGVDDPSGVFGSTLQLHVEFGSDRVVDTPLAEEAVTGIANGAALCGLRPVVVHARVEFLLLALNQVLNHAAKWRAMYGPRSTMPVVYRAVIGRGWGQGAQHSQSLQSLFLNVPGLAVVMPATASDAKGLLARALESNGPVVFIEHRQLYGLEEDVPVEHYSIPFGRARVHRTGDDLTIVAWSQMLHEALRAAEALAATGVNAEVIDPRTLAPLDEATIFASVARTGRLVIAENGWTDCGPSAEIAARCAGAIFDNLRAPIARVGFPRLATPSSHVLEHAYYPNWETIRDSALATLELRGAGRREVSDAHSLRESW